MSLRLALDLAGLAGAFLAGAAFLAATFFLAGADLGLFFLGGFFRLLAFLLAGFVFEVFFLEVFFLEVFFFATFFFTTFFLLVFFRATGFFLLTFFFLADFFTAGFLRVTDFLLLDTFFLLTLRFLAAVVLRLRAFRAVAFFEAMCHSCRSEKRRELYIDGRNMEADSGCFFGYFREQVQVRIRDAVWRPVCGAIGLNGEADCGRYRAMRAQPNGSVRCFSGPLLPHW